VTHCPRTNRRYPRSIAVLRQRCFTLLLALLAWIVVPTAPRLAAAGPTPASMHAAAGPGAPGAIERASNRSDRRARPESRHDAMTGAAAVAIPSASIASFVLLLDRDATFVARPLVAALPRGPPLA
jgi:hypothetical protein